MYPALGDRARVASKHELELAFCGNRKKTVRVGTIQQDSSIPAMVRVDDLLGKHFAILGTTGTGKSCTTALILRAIVEKNPNAHILLLDPHNEYATSFGDLAEVISPRNMQLPFWLLNFEEIVEVLVGDPSRKAEIEILQELIPMAKSRYSSGRAREGQNVRRGVIDPSRCTVDTPVPYRVSDLTSLIDERMGKLENKKDLAPYRQLKARIDAISQDGRYAFMFGSLTVYDGMTQVLGRIFRVPVNSHPITILELTGLPTEIINVVVSVLCRLTFDFALWSEGQVPVTLVCEEAHRYVPANAALGLRAVPARHRQDRQGGPQVRRLALRRHAAPRRDRPDHPVQCNTVFALQDVERSRPADRALRALRHGLGHDRLPLRARPARGDRLRRRRDPARAHQVRRAAAPCAAALLHRSLLGKVADVRGRRGLPGPPGREVAPGRYRHRHGHRRAGRHDRRQHRAPARLRVRAGAAPAGRRRRDADPYGGGQALPHRRELLRREPPPLTPSVLPDPAPAGSGIRTPARAAPAALALVPLSLPRDVLRHLLLRAG